MCANERGKTEKASDPNDAVLGGKNAKGNKSIAGALKLQSFFIFLSLPLPCTL